MTRRLLISLRPQHAQEIYTGRKHFEFRRARMRVNPGDVVVIYETMPVGAVTGEFTVGSVAFGGSELADLEPDLRRAVAAEYLAGARVASALQVSSPRRYRRARRLADVGVSRAPQSYCWLDR